MVQRHSEVLTSLRLSDAPATEMRIPVSNLLLGSEHKHAERLLDEDMQLSLQQTWKTQCKSHGIGDYRIAGVFLLTLDIFPKEGPCDPRVVMWCLVEDYMFPWTVLKSAVTSANSKSVSRASAAEFERALLANRRHGPYQCWNPECQKPFTARIKSLCCSQCGYARYCSRDCQMTAWPAHSAWCAEAVALQTPDALRVRARLRNTEKGLK